MVANSGPTNSGEGAKSMAANSGPTNSDVIAMFGKIQLQLKNIDTRLQSLDTLEKKVDNFEKEQKKLWLHIDKIAKENTEKLNRVENKVDSFDIELEGARRRIADLEKEKDKLKDDMNYVQSQSMRNNLLFGNIPEELNEIDDVNEVPVSQTSRGRAHLRTQQVSRSSARTRHRGNKQRFRGLPTTASPTEVAKSAERLKRFGTLSSGSGQRQAAFLATIT